MLACVPKKPTGGSSSSTDRSTTDSTPTFVLASAKGGALSTALPVDDSGYYHSQHSSVTFTGGCRGLDKVKVTLTPDSESPVVETVSCQATLFNWNKSFSTQKRYLVEFEATDSADVVLTQFSKISRYLVYDTTAPAAATLILPTNAATYSVSNGQTEFTITGQVGLDTKSMVLNSQIPVTLTPNGDGIHQDFSVNVTVPVGQTLPFAFAARDFAMNAATTTLTITSNFALVIPIAQLAPGGKYSPGGLNIFSSLTLDGTQSTNQTVQLSVGTPALVEGQP